MKSFESFARELDEAAAAFAKGELGPARARSIRDTDAGFDRQVFKRMADLGWTGILVPEAYGGLGLGLSEMTAVIQRLARSILPEPLTTSAVIAAAALSASDNEVLKAELLTALCSGDLMPTVAWQEQFGDLEGTQPQSVAAERDGGWEITGVKLHVPFATAADGFVVSALASSGAALFWAPASASGIHVETERLADGTTDGRVRFERSPAQSMQSRGNLQALTVALDMGRVVASAELLGVARQCLDITLEYIRTRTQFGKPIGSFQAMQHRAVDLFMLTQLASSALGRAVATFEGDEPIDVKAAAASHAKARCSETALEVAREGIQMHGAIGWTDECDVGLYVKRALVQSAWLGNAAAHRRRYARLSPFMGTH